MPRHLNNLGYALAACRDHTKAIADYDAAIRLDPAFAAAWNNRGLTFIALSRDRDTLGDFDRTLAIEPVMASRVKSAVGYSPLPSLCSLDNDTWTRGSFGNSAVEVRTTQRRRAMNAADSRVRRIALAVRSGTSAGMWVVRINTSMTFRITMDDFRLGNDRARSCGGG